MPCLPLSLVTVTLMMPSAPMSTPVAPSSEVSLGVCVFPSSFPRSKLQPESAPTSPSPVASITILALKYSVPDFESVTTDFVDLVNANTDYDNEPNFRYFTRIGMVYDNNIYASDTNFDVRFIVNTGTEDAPVYKYYASAISFNKSLSSTPIILYDMTADKPKVSSSHKLSEIRSGDMVYIWRGEGGVYKGIYVFRYKEDVLGEADKLLNSPAEAPATLSLEELSPETLDLPDMALEEITIEEIISDSATESADDDISEISPEIADAPVTSEDVATEEAIIPAPSQDAA